MCRHIIIRRYNIIIEGYYNIIRVNNNYNSLSYLQLAIILNRSKIN